MSSTAVYTAESSTTVTSVARELKTSGSSLLFECGEKRYFKQSCEDETALIHKCEKA